MQDVPVSFELGRPHFLAYLFVAQPSQASLQNSEGTKRVNTQHRYAQNHIHLAVGLASLFAARISLALPVREHTFERADAPNGAVTITAGYDFIITTPGKVTRQEEHLRSGKSTSRSGKNGVNDGGSRVNTSKRSMKNAGAASIKGSSTMKKSRSSVEKSRSTGAH